jgi:uncharacterized protein (TIGR02246 family)
MKPKILVLIIALFAFFSCTKQTKAPLTKEEKNELTKEVNAVINSMEEGMKKLNASQAFETTFLLNDDFKYIDIHGKVLNSKAFMEEVHSVFDDARKVDFGFSEPDIRIVNSDVAIVTLIYHGTFYFPESTLAAPDCGSTLVLEKTEEGWKVIHFQESLQESEFVQTPLNN